MRLGILLMLLLICLFIVTRYIQCVNILYEMTCFQTCALSVISSGIRQNSTALLTMIDDLSWVKHCKCMKLLTKKIIHPSFDNSVSC